MSNLRQLLTQVSIPELAKFLGCHRSTVYRYRDGHTLPSQERAKAMIAWFAERGKDLDYNGIYGKESCRADEQN